MSISFNPVAGFQNFFEHKALPALDAARDSVRDGMVSAWNKMPGNEAAEALIGKVADRLPFNNAAEAAFRALAGQKEVKLDKDATDGIQRDPSFLKVENDINDKVKSKALENENYGKRAFDIPLSEVLPETKGNTLLELGGQRGNMDPKDQALQAWDLSNPEIRKTWKVAGNEQTWLLRHCTLNGTAHVAKDGTITIDYKVRDTLDLSAQPGREGAYNAVSKVLGGVWHGLMGAEQPQMTGTFTRTVPGVEPLVATGPNEQDPSHTSKYVP
jgi:hypothetical protein